MQSGFGPAVDVVVTEVVSLVEAEVDFVLLEVSLEEALEVVVDCAMVEERVELGEVELETAELVLSDNEVVELALVLGSLEALAEVTVLVTEEELVSGTVRVVTVVLVVEGADCIEIGLDR